VPRYQKWVRIQPIEGLPTKKIAELAAKSGLGVKEEANQDLTVYGKPEPLREFIRKIAAQTPKKAQ
jgi:hypothetical protein